MASVAIETGTAAAPSPVVHQGLFRLLRSGSWGVELREVGYENVEGDLVEVVRRSDGTRSRFRLVKCVSRRRGRLHPLYGIERIPKDES